MKKMIFFFLFLQVGFTHAVDETSTPILDVLTIDIIGDNYRSNMEVALQKDDDVSSIMNYIQGAATLRSHMLTRNPMPNVTDLCLIVSWRNRMMCIGNVKPIEACNLSDASWYPAVLDIITFVCEQHD